MPYQRDPVSQIFDPLTRRALARCYKNPQRWVPVRLPRITPRVYIAWLGRNVDLRQRDPWKPELDRWARSFIRSAYYQHYWFGGFDGMQSQRRAAKWDGLSLIYDATEELTGWRVRLIAAPQGFKIPGRKPAEQYHDQDGVYKGVRVGGLGAGSEL